MRLSEWNQARCKLPFEILQAAQLYQSKLRQGSVNRLCMYVCLRVRMHVLVRAHVKHAWM